MTVDVAVDGTVLLPGFEPGATQVEGAHVGAVGALGGVDRIERKTLGHHLGQGWGVRHARRQEITARNCRDEAPCQQNPDLVGPGVQPVGEVFECGAHGIGVGCSGQADFGTPVLE